MAMNMKNIKFLGTISQKNIVIRYRVHDMKIVRRYSKSQRNGKYTTGSIFNWFLYYKDVQLSLIHLSVISLSPGSSL